MERREFVQLLCFGMGVASVATAAKALPLAPALADSGPVQAPERSVANSEDMERAQVEKAYYGHWRRVGRRHYRRTSRRVYRRHHYY